MTRAALESYCSTPIPGLPLTVKTVVQQLLKRAPHPPSTSSHASTSIIDEVHNASHDPNATLLLAVSDDDREAKINGIPKAFLQGRQDALDKYVQSPGDFKQFLEEKQKANRGMLEFYTGNPDVRSSVICTEPWLEQTLA